uniref:ATP-dependent Clp protease proteolytic subunit n=1 Tax=Glaucocystis sp. BBH TaxID=2023628 RepID=A0A3G1IUY0_9EUKA|nr:ATP-dependent Clp protease proteolytic subunit ClpP [Glaucocystis sp. BBH]
MSIGVPQVPFNISTKQSEWIEVYDLFYTQRLIVLCQDIDNEITNHICALFLYLNTITIRDFGYKTKENMGKYPRLFFYINSMGGPISSALAIYDVMGMMESEITTLCMGVSAGSSTLLLTKGQTRIGLIHSRIMMSQPISSGIDGPATNLEIEVKQMNKYIDIMSSIYAKRTMRPRLGILNDMKRDYFFSAREAKQYGLIDGVANDNDPENEKVMFGWTFNPKYRIQVDEGFLLNLSS